MLTFASCIYPVVLNQVLWHSKDLLTESINDIFYTINQFLIQEEQINTSILYLDGTKIEANANKFSFVWKKSILNYRDKLYLKISKAIIDIKKDLHYNLLLKNSYHIRDLNLICTVLENEVDRLGIEFVYGLGKRKTYYQRYYEYFHSYRDKLNEYEKHLNIRGERNSYSKTDHDATFMRGKKITTVKPVFSNPIIIFK